MNINENNVTQHWTTFLIFCDVTVFVCVCVSGAVKNAYNSRENNDFPNLHPDLENNVISLVYFFFFLKICNTVFVFCIAEIIGAYPDCRD